MLGCDTKRGSALGQPPSRIVGLNVPLPVTGMTCNLWILQKYHVLQVKKFILNRVEKTFYHTQDPTSAANATSRRPHTVAEKLIS